MRSTLMLVLERVDVHAAYVRSSLMLVFFLKTVCDAGHIQVKNTRTGSADSRLSCNCDLHCWDGRDCGIALLLYFPIFLLYSSMLARILTAFALSSQGPQTGVTRLFTRS